MHVESTQSLESVSSYRKPSETSMLPLVEEGLFPGGAIQRASGVYQAAMVDTVG